jgi:hypothetical protein
MRVWPALTNGRMTSLFGVSVLLLLIGLVTLIVGLVADSLSWVLVSMGSTVAAGVALLLLERCPRQAVGSTPRPPPQSASEIAIVTGSPSSSPTST